MGVARKREAEVPLRLRAVPREHQAPQEHHVDRPFVLAAPRQVRPGLQAGSHVAPVGGPGPPQEAARGGLELLHLVGRGLFVDPEQERVSPPGEELGHRGVRRQHELLDDPVRLPSRGRAHGDGHPLLHLDLRFRKVEIQGAPAGAGQRKPPRRGRHVAQHPPDLALVFPGEAFVHLVVREPRPAPDDGRMERRASRASRRGGSAPPRSSSAGSRRPSGCTRPPRAREAASGCTGRGSRRWSPGRNASRSRADPGST